MSALHSGISGSWTIPNTSKITKNVSCRPWYFIIYLCLTKILVSSSRVQARGWQKRSTMCDAFEWSFFFLLTFLSFFVCTKCICRLFSILSVNYKYSSHIFGSNRLTMCALGICVWNAAERRAFSDIIRNRLWNSRGIVVGGGILDISHTNLGLVHDLLKFVIILRIRS